jgi:arylsulfatase A-like enzyme
VIRRVFAAALALAAIACDRPVPPGAIVPRLRALRSPNIVLIVVDTLRPDWTGPYGDARDPTPELSRWAARGVVFERVLAQSSWTKVSMASLLTSLWPHSHAVRETTDGLGDGALTLAEVFQASGYRTYGVQSNGWLEQTFGFHQGFERYMFPRGGGGPALRPSIWPHADNVYLEADRLISAHPPDAPFFLYLHFMDVHEYAAPPDHKRFGEDDRGAYVAAIAWVDEVIERLRRRLDHAGLLDRSVLVLASDHGETFGEGGAYGHARNVLAPVLRVPLVIRLPFPVEPVRVTAPVRNLDVAPTCLDLAGIPVPSEFEGRSLLPWIADPARAVDLPAYASLPALLYRDAVLQNSLSEGPWTFARNVGEPKAELLFDAAVDPDANVNLVEIERERAAALRATLDAHLARAPTPGVAQKDVRIAPDLAEKLRALGYLR